MLSRLSSTLLRPPEATPDRSPPEQKQPPSPRSTIARTSSSSCTSSTAAHSSLIMGAPMAFLRAGLFSTISATPVSCFSM